MDERLKYEQLIGDKLQSLPVPDMQDAIWARVKAQLDLDLPTDDGEGDSSPEPPSGPKIIGRGLSVVMIVLVTVFFLFKNKSAEKNNLKPLPSIEQNPSPNTQNNSPPIPKSNTVNNIPAPAAAGDNKVLPNGNADSAFNYNPVVATPLVGDSVPINLPQAVSLSSPPPADTTSVTPKKGRGMTGLDDSSYRIVPKKP